MDIYVKRFGSEEPAIKFADIDEEELVHDFKERVSAAFDVPLDQIRLINDGGWSSLLLENVTVDEISTNFVHLVVLPEDRTWDQFFFFVKPFNGEPILVEGDFLETVASVKSRLPMTEEPRPSDDQIGLIHKWTMLDDAMGFDDETVDMAVGCTLDLFVRDTTQVQKLVFKSTVYKNFTIAVDLNETTD